MTDDANFCDGRLRLRAFLRVVENDMPQRPSRFKRRHMQPAENAPFDPAGHEPKASANITKAANTTPVPHQTEIRKSSTRSREPLRTRKRKLPVNCLALLQTTTSDGLPEPGDAHKAFTTPTTETDPIDDSQLDACTIQRRNEIILSVNGRIPQQGRSYATKQARNTSPVPTALTTPPALKLRSQPLLGVHHLADGFEGRELELVPTKKPSRKEKPVGRKAKPVATVAGLDLACGSLPVSAIHHA